MSEYVDVTDLPAPIQSALKSVGFGKANISVEASATVHLGNSGSGKGSRAFTVLVDLDTGKSVTTHGSWGGVNMFNPSNAVDNDDRAYALPPNGVAIMGSTGGGKPTMARLHIPASMVSRIITAGPVEALPTDQLTALAIFTGYKASYRAEELARYKVPASTLDTLVAAGLLKRNRAGATSVTTAGQNAVSDYRLPSLYKF